MSDKSALRYLAQAVVDNVSFDEDSGRDGELCRYCIMPMPNHDHDCAYVIAKEVLDGERTVLDEVKHGLGQAIHAAKKIGGPWGPACGYTDEAGAYIEVDYNGGPPGEYACECESMSHHLIELRQQEQQGEGHAVPDRTSLDT